MSLQLRLIGKVFINIQWFVKHRRVGLPTKRKGADLSSASIPEVKSWRKTDKKYKFSTYFTLINYMPG